MQLHKKYGLNPTQSICAHCKKVKDIALLGDSIKRRAKKKMKLDSNLCDECKQKKQEKTLYKTTKRWYRRSTPPKGE